MRSKFGTALALVGVLLTGTAAAAINTQALISPTESTLGTAATTLLPVDQAVAVIPGQVQVSPGTPVQSSTASAPQAQVTSSPVTQQGTSATPNVATPVTNQPTASVASASKSPSVVYGNPNPSNGDDDDDDDEEDDDDDDEDDD